MFVELNYDTNLWETESNLERQTLPSNPEWSLENPKVIVLMAIGYCTVSPPYLPVPNLQIQPMLDPVLCLWSMRFEYLQTLASEASPGPNPCRYWGMTVYAIDLGGDEKDAKIFFPIGKMYLYYSSIKLKLNRKTPSSLWFRKWWSHLQMILTRCALFFTTTLPVISC